MRGGAAEAPPFKGAVVVPFDEMQRLRSARAKWDQLAPPIRTVPRCLARNRAAYALSEPPGWRVYLCELCQDSAEAFGPVVESLYITRADDLDALMLTLAWHREPAALMRRLRVIADRLDGLAPLIEPG